MVISGILVREGDRYYVDCTEYIGDCSPHGEGSTVDEAVRSFAFSVDDLTAEARESGLHVPDYTIEIID